MRNLYRLEEILTIITYRSAEVFQAKIGVKHYILAHYLY